MKEIVIEGCPAKIYIDEIETTGRTVRRKEENRAVDRLVKEVFSPEAERRHRPDGAPLIEGTDDNISIAHSLHIAVLAVSAPDIYIGIDIENDRSQLPKVCHRILSKEEYDYFSSMPKGFLKAWTTKEALYKASRQLFDHEPDYAADLHILPELSAAGHLFTDYNVMLESGEMITVVTG